MAQLERHPEGLRMGELSKRMMVTGGNVTGIADQLEQEGWWRACPIRRTAAPSGQADAAGRTRLRRDGGRARGWIAELLQDMSAADKGS
jgi:DNA-binding MarR family transcriptional regulator